MSTPDTSLREDELAELWRKWGIIPDVANGSAATASRPADFWLEMHAHIDHGALLRTAGELFVRGAPLDWRGIYADSARTRVPLPFYPFERKRHTLLGRQPSGASVIGSLEVSKRASAAPASTKDVVLSSQPERRREAAVRYMESTTRHILRVTDVELDSDLPLLAMGFDSIMASELMNVLKRDFDFEMSAVAFLDGASLRGVADVLCAHLDGNVREEGYV